MDFRLLWGSTPVLFNKYFLVDVHISGIRNPFHLSLFSFPQPWQTSWKHTLVFWQWHHFPGPSSFSSSQDLVSATLSGRGREMGLAKVPLGTTGKARCAGGWEGLWDLFFRSISPAWVSQIRESNRALPACPTQTLGCSGSIYLVAIYPVDFRHFCLLESLAAFILQRNLPNQLQCVIFQHLHHITANPLWAHTTPRFCVRPVHRVPVMSS